MASILRRRDVMSWCLYDWANSAFITSVTVTFLPIFYSQLFVDPNAVQLNVLGLTWNTSCPALLSYTNGLYMIAVAALAPVLGAIADSARGKKKFLAFCATAGGLLTMALAVPTQGQFLLCSGLYAAAGFLWSAGNIFYDGFLPELTEDPRQMDTISSAGYGIGYLGGGLMLLLNVVMATHPGWFGLPDAMAALRVSFVLVGLWWALFTLPLLAAVKERPLAAGTTRTQGYVRQGFRQLKQTLSKVSRLPELAKFLVAFLLYDTGVGTLIIVAAMFAKSDRAIGGLGLDQGAIIGCLLMIQFVGLPAAFGFIWLARKVGTRNSVFIGIAVYTAVVIYAMHVTTAAEFWVLGLGVALVQGGTQAMSRSLFGSMLPQGLSAEFFGFFSVFNKVGSFVGPMLFGLMLDLTGSFRWAILFLIVFFALGFAMLLWVRVGRGQQQARTFAAAHA